VQARSARFAVVAGSVHAPAAVRLRHLQEVMEMRVRRAARVTSRDATGAAFVVDGVFISAYLTPL